MFGPIRIPKKGVLTRTRKKKEHTLGTEGNVHLNGSVTGSEPQVGGASGARLETESGNNVADRMTELVVERFEHLSVKLERLLVLVGRDLENHVINSHCCGCVEESVM